jgi:hypothetical protein
MTDAVIDPRDASDAVVEPCGWFSVELRYAYLVGDPGAPILVEDRVVLIEGEDEETALGRAVELATDYEDDFETEDGRAGMIRFEGIVAIKELDDPPAIGTEVWHEFMSPSPTPGNGDPDAPPPLRPEEMAFPRAHDD